MGEKLSDYERALRVSEWRREHPHEEFPDWANLSGANLNKAYFWGLDLRRADLHEADLSGAYFREANLYGANLGEANLSGADFRWADLREATLYGAKLGGANLGGAKLYGADLRGADFGDGVIWSDEIVRTKKP